MSTQLVLPSYTPLIGKHIGRCFRCRRKLYEGDSFEILRMFWHGPNTGGVEFSYDCGCDSKAHLYGFYVVGRNDD